MGCPPIVNRIFPGLANCDRVRELLQSSSCGKVGLQRITGSQWSRLLSSEFLVFSKIVFTQLPRLPMVGYRTVVNHGRCSPGEQHRICAEFRILRGKMRPNYQAMRCSYTNAKDALPNALHGTQDVWIRECSTTIGLAWIDAPIPVCVPILTSSHGRRGARGEL